jgi:hypothetical protein
MPTPANLSDFSMFPNGLAPSQGLWIAMDDNWTYTYQYGQSGWQKTPRAN